MINKTFSLLFFISIVLSQGACTCIYSSAECSTVVLGFVVVDDGVNVFTKTTYKIEDLYITSSSNEELKVTIEEGLKLRAEPKKGVTYLIHLDKQTSFSFKVEYEMEASECCPGPGIASVYFDDNVVCMGLDCSEIVEFPI